MAITQTWRTARGTLRETERAAQIREDAENLAVDAQMPGLPLKLAADMLEALMSKGKLVVPGGA